MVLSTKVLQIAFYFGVLCPLAQGAFPVVDRAHGLVQERPYCPARPASPEFQRDALGEFLHEFFGGGLVKESLDAFTSDNYIQHNPFILSGRNNSIAALSPGAYDFSKANVTILQVLFDSPFGMVHYKVELPDQPPTAITDIWRFNGTCIEEHWDVIQALPANAKNPLALF
ncbi:hypothetical protein AK830_g11411 [Neonectria ditissima]|uniref:SnoaL-like domain-containing protein n=1 Tax=Neonectria ditissima TaxID=78410 RepID=A0A0P7B868_9HYPO|nr:hypothetical protein AK830_g11411 [Neonectria ditissima]